VDVLGVVVLLGVLVVTTVLLARRPPESSENRGCDEARQVVQGAVDQYLAQNQVSVIPGTGVGPDRFEQTLVDAQLLAATSTEFEVSENGAVTATGEPCT
jgi:hypothetical protein